MSKLFDAAKNIEFVGRTDQGGRADGIQCMIHRGHAYVSHVFSGGVSVIDVRDPRHPRPVNFLPTHPRSWSVHCQTANDILLVVEEFNFYSVYVDESEYYGHSIEGVHSSKFGKRGDDYSAGMRVYDVSDPANPRAIGFMEVEGLGLHRIWWTGGDYAYASALLDGYTDHVFIIIDMHDPARPRIVSQWALPGMHAADGETMTLPGRVALHHALVAGDIAYGAWRDGGLVLLDIADKSAPKFISRTSWSPPYPSGTHSALPLLDRGLCVVADEATLDRDQEEQKYTWMVDIRAPENPVTIATFPTPSDQDYVAKGGHFGPHNLHENRPEGFQSSDIVFATYQNAGVRVFDIRDQFRPAEIGYFVPSAPEQWVDPRPARHQVIHTCDVNVQKDGLIYITDYNAGLYILQWKG
ncbi:LVIVD repeat-containing protein [Sphingomonas bacterium]|uniref:LVIVD repeat-containing protein n=1 Tax=Sphingomonas bacterium TaxID=1895847 RepID=UPI001576620D|nr:hypothetical protein [Sphingomonas bacterium]